VNIIKNLIKKFKKDKKNIAVLGIFIPDPQNPKNKKLKPIITGVDEAGPSHDVLKENDLILKINEKKINTLKEYENAQKKLKPNEIIIVRVKRRNQELNRAIRTISLEDFEKPKQIHYVRFGFYFTTPIMMRKKDWNKQPTKVLAVAKKSYARNKIKHGDIITAINNVPITNIEEYYIEIKKVLWGESVLFSILRNNKKISFKIKSKSFYDYKLHSVQFGIETKIFKKKYNKVIETQSLFSEGDLIKKGDLILDLTSTVSGKLFKKKIIDDDDLYRTVIENFEPTQRINLNILRKNEKKIIEIKLENFFDFIQKNESLTRNSGFLNKPKADFMLREYENGSYEGLSDELRMKIVKMDLEEEIKVRDDEKLFISSYVKKEKVSGKDSFVVYYDSFPSTYNFEEDTVYLKIYVFDLTDLDQKEYEDIYYETEDYEDNPRLENYIRDNCNVIKSNNFDWSEGSSVLVQTKLLNPYEDPPEKIAFPYSVMNFPKAGKRRLAFRSFICKKDLKFHETEGRPLNGSFVNYRPEHFKLDLYGDSFDEYGSYPEILGYDSTEIEAEYKQAGYLGVNRQKLDSLIIPLGYSIASINNDPLKSIELVKDNIAYKGDRTLEGGINQALNLKMIYEKSQKNIIDPQIYLKEIKNFSKIDERYEVINLLLNIATHDNTLTSTENKFLDDVAEKLELNQSKYLEIKKIETASLKSVDFGDKADESIFGLSKDMDDKTKCRILRQEYSRWNSQTNNSNKDKRVRAKEMVNLIANLRKQYNC
tara:strand:- start:4847 stop:7144 length:2298 start_codon:yes stop_codon:yes gene_type:complete